MTEGMIQWLHYASGAEKPKVRIEIEGQRTMIANAARHGTT